MSVGTSPGSGLVSAASDAALPVRPQVHRLDDYRPPDFAADAISLSFEVMDEHVIVEALTCVRRLSPGVRHLALHGEGLELLGLRLDDVPVPVSDYELDDRQLVLKDVPDRCAVWTRCRIRPQDNTTLIGMYTTAGLLCTQCEPEGFRRITWALDRPDVLSTYTVTLIADRPRYPVLLSNGNMLGSGILPGGRHWARWHDPFPKPSYLFALVAGDLDCLHDTFVTRSGRRIRLGIHVAGTGLARCSHAMDMLKQSMAWDETVYGLEIDLDVFNVVAVPDFNVGGMENKGLNIFSTQRILADRDTATDEDYVEIGTVVSHEYFHNWTGNRVTLRDWFQLCLKEGLTVFRDQQFCEHLLAPGVKRVADVQRLRLRQFPEDHGPMAHAVRPDAYLEINNFYTATVYDKGAELIRMLYVLLGSKAYYAGICLYLERYDGRAATVEEFLACMAETSARDLEQFARWYTTAGTPRIDVRASHDPVTKTCTVRFRQSMSDPSSASVAPLHIPVAMALLGPDGRELPLQLRGDPLRPARSVTLELREADQEFTFEEVASRPVPSLLRGMSAPVMLRAEMSADDLAFLVTHDSDYYVAWDAMQQLFTRVLQRRAATDAPAAVASDPATFAAFAALLADESRDPAFRARALVLPPLQSLFLESQRVDVDALHAAWRGLAGELGSEFAMQLHECRQKHSATGPFRALPEDAGRRALRNRALWYLARSGLAVVVETCIWQLETADNLTDRLAALASLAELDCDERREVLDRFHRRWCGDPLVLDRWLSLQAAADRAGVTCDIERLATIPQFDRRNPNRVRALYGTFAWQNPGRFHAADGSGYRLLGEFLAGYEHVNPRMAAFMARSFEHWRRFDDGRADLMRAQLERLHGLPGVSPDMLEVTTRALGP